MKRQTEVIVNTAINAVILFLYMLFVVILQTTLFPRLAIKGIVPDIALAVVLTLAIYRGENTAALFGCVTGFFLEAVGSSGLSLLPLFYILVGIVGGIIGKNARKDRLFAAFCVSLPLFALFKAICEIFYHLIKNSFILSWKALIFNYIIIELLYTCCVAVLLYFLTRFVAQRMLDIEK